MLTGLSMAEEEEGERRKEKSLSTLRKRILPCKRKTTTATATRNPNPSLTSCHRCNKKKATPTGLQALESQWRIALLCGPCLGLVRRAEACSYCFLRLSKEEDIFLNCLRCFRRVHYACIPAHPYYVSASQLDPESFSCVDCCPAPMWSAAAEPGLSAAVPGELEPPRWVINGSKRVLKSSRRLLLSPDGDGTGPALPLSPARDVSLDLDSAEKEAVKKEIEGCGSEPADEKTRYQSSGIIDVGASPKVALPEASGAEPNQ